jgi:hypothetical protein
MQRSPRGVLSVTDPTATATPSMNRASARREVRVGRVRGPGPAGRRRGPTSMSVVARRDRARACAMSGLPRVCALTERTGRPWRDEKPGDGVTGSDQSRWRMRRGLTRWPRRRPGGQSGSLACELEYLGTDGSGLRLGVDLRKDIGVNVDGQAHRRLLIRGFRVRAPGGPQR